MVSTARIRQHQPARIFVQVAGALSNKRMSVKTRLHMVVATAVLSLTSTNSVGSHAKYALARQHHRQQRHRNHRAHVRTFAQEMDVTFLRTLSVKIRAALGGAAEGFLLYSTNIARNHVENAKITRDTLL